ncbi:Zn(II)2Cys6 transcription factor domain-containing protein [Aspergillus undulatus]|uniref:Zn(II)2Cys6 transcription factor domain-containing protein n=1 Tax=Aspergillus undulatus TaxID=1810928 RepID=UPI003CCCC4EF
MSSQSSSQHGSTSRVGKRRAAPYGQACLHCFKTKSKCVRQGNDDTCERCSRLNKQCCSAESLRKRSSQKSSDSAAEIARLQTENDTLHEMLSKYTPQIAYRDAIVTQNEDTGKGKQTLDQPPVQSVSGQTSTVLNNWRLSPDQEEARLSIFRDQKLPFLAFMRLPSGVTAQTLREEKPLLFRAIMTCTSPLIQEKQARSKELKGLLIQKALGDIESSLDLLLSALTYLGWGFDTFVNHLNTSSPSRLTQVAMAVAYDLRYDLSKPKEAYLFPNEVMSSDSQAGRKGNTDDSIRQSLDVKRALLGCFLLTSLTSSHYQRVDPMRWTPQMEEYLGSISRVKEDELFSLQVRLQALAQQVREQRDLRELDRCQVTTESTALTSTGPLLNRWYLEALQRKLQEITATIPPHLEKNEILISQLHYTSLCIYETMHPVNPNIEFGFSSLGMSSTLDERECHYHTLQTIRSFFDNLSRFSALNWAGFPWPIWVQSIRCAAVLLRLSTPPSQRDEVRKVVDPITVVDWISEKVSAAAIEAGEKSPTDLLGILHRVSRTLRRYMGAMLEPTPVEQPAAGAYVGTPNFYNSGSDSGVDMSTSNDFAMQQQYIMIQEMLSFDNITYNEPLGSSPFYGSVPLYYGYNSYTGT